MIESGAYEQKPIPGSTRKLVSVWLYWRPEPPPDVSTPTPAPRRPAKKGVKKEKGVKVEPEAKAEKKVKAELSSKCPRPTSGEVSTPKRFTITRQRARELGEGLLREGRPRRPSTLWGDVEGLKGAGAGDTRRR